jgi:hypothetical protein
MLFPRVAHFLTQEMERASVVADNSDLRENLSYATARVGGREGLARG